MNEKLMSGVVVGGVAMLMVGILKYFQVTADSVEPLSPETNEVAQVKESEEHGIENLPNFQSKALDTGVPWDEMRMSFSGMVARNMTVREKDNILLNELYGGVPPVTVSNMTSLITGGRV
tara:strand:+ start:225 stop:584 length:360 start_codon:yes stop_codon:yes gene_type:complete